MTRDALVGDGGQLKLRRLRSEIAGAGKNFALAQGQSGREHAARRFQENGICSNKRKRPQKTGTFEG